MESCTKLCGVKFKKLVPSGLQANFGQRNHRTEAFRMLEPRGVLITRVYRSVNCRLITGWLVMFCALLMTATGALAQSGPPTLGFLLPNHGGPGESVAVTLVGTNFTSDMTVSVADLTITVTDVSFLTSETATATFLISDPAHGGRNVSTSLRHLHSEFKLP